MSHRRTALWIGTLLLAAGCAAGPQSSAPELQVLRDVIYGHKAGMALTLDVYSPAAPNGAGILFMNSGGYFSPTCTFLTDVGEPLRILTDAELDEGQPLCREVKPEFLASRGFTVFDVRHGSSPRFNVTEANEDVRLALRFVRDHASEYGVDPSRLGAWGGSAGGQLALMLGLSGDPGAAAEDSSGNAVAAVVAYFPPHDLEGIVREAPEMAQMFPAVAISADELRAVSPVNFVSPDDPPTLVIHGDADELVLHEWGEAMYLALRADGVESEFITLAGAPHGFTGAHADSALAATLAWFEAHLAP